MQAELEVFIPNTDDRYQQRRFKKYQCPET